MSITKQIKKEKIREKRDMLLNLCTEGKKLKSKESVLNHIYKKYYEKDKQLAKLSSRQGSEFF